ncbi:hypothetical protein RRG08_022591 [Elysia crispata]|uniref:Uncharacterized protein n=1 Tax=Elysia crispata TaxID=231223 RepID=A0AAE1D8G8_9GAST|nr:hypothetical protein RRG08_022591 [Elysia crispata]
MYPGGELRRACDYPWTIMYPGGELRRACDYPWTVMYPGGAPWSESANRAAAVIPHLARPTRQADSATTN